MSVRRIGCTAAVAVLLAGCGQKGPLFLPDKPQDVVTRPAPGEQAPAATPSGTPPASVPAAPAPPEGSAAPKKDEDASTTPRR